LGLLASETDRERRLILLLSLRWGDEQATTTLLANLDDLDAEIATAAACALVDIQPDAAIPKLKKLLEMVEESSITELEINDAEEKVRIVKHGVAPAQAYAYPPLPQAHPATPPAPAATKP